MPDNTDIWPATVERLERHVKGLAARLEVVEGQLGNSQRVAKDTANAQIANLIRRLDAQQADIEDIVRELRSLVNP